MRRTIGVIFRTSAWIPKEDGVRQPGALPCGWWGPRPVTSAPASPLCAEPGLKGRGEPVPRRAVLGGEQQRGHCTGVLVNPSTIVADEPTGTDPNCLEIMTLLSASTLPLAPLWCR